MSLYDLFTKINQGLYAPLSASRYSSELRYLIDSMLRVDPNERVDIKDVVKYCEVQLEALNKVSQGGTSWRLTRMDPILIMDDILEKLHLLDYLKKFCKVKGRKSISRTYFAIKEPNIAAGEQLRYFFELSYWLIGLSQES